MPLKTIQDSRADKKGEFIAVCLKVGDLKSGTKNGRDWSMRNITVQDASETTELTLWTEDIDACKVGGKYKFKGFWSEYNGRAQWSKGKYGDITLIEENATPPAPQAQTAQSPPPGPPNTAKEFYGDCELSGDKVKSITKLTAELNQAEVIIEETLKGGSTNCEIPPAKIGLYLKLIMDAGLLK